MKQVFLLSIIMSSIACNSGTPENTNLPRKHIKNVSNIDRMGLKGKVRKAKYFIAIKPINENGNIVPDYARIDRNNPMRIEMYDTNGFITTITYPDLSTEHFIYQNDVLVSTETRIPNHRDVIKKIINWDDSLTFTTKKFLTHPDLGDSIILLSVTRDAFYPNYRLKEHIEYNESDSFQTIHIQQRHSYNTSYTIDSMLNPKGEARIIQTVKKHDHQGNPTDIYIVWYPDAQFKNFNIIEYEYYQ